MDDLNRERDLQQDMDADANLATKMLAYKKWAVIGANSIPDKYGYKVYKRLRDKGYEVYPVNPVCNEIDGDKCYPDLDSLPEKPEVINMVVSPKRGRAILNKAAELGIKYVWLQPGTHNEKIMAQIDELGLTAFQGCVLVATR